MTQERPGTFDGSSRGPIIVIAFIAAVALLLSGVCVFFMSKGLLAAHEQAALIARAVPVQAVVTDSRVDPSRDAPGVSTRKRGRTSRGSEPVVAFEYAFQGSSFSAETIWPLRRRGSAEWARAQVAKYPPASQVTAHVDPEHPDHAFLEPVHTLEPYLATVTGGISLSILVLIGCFCLAASRRTRGRPWTVAAAIAVGSGLVVPLYAWAHYMSVSSESVHTMAVPAAIVYVSLLTGLVQLARRHRRRLMADASRAAAE